MFRTDFCEINLLREMIASRKNWPNVVINTTTRAEYRTDIQGTLSIFSSNKGTGHYAADNCKVAVGSDTFFISNEDQCYSIDIQQTKAVETFNIHFSTQMLRKLQPALLLKHEQLLDGDEHISNEVNFYNKLYWKDDVFRSIVSLLQQKSADGELNDMMTDEILSSLLEHLHTEQLGFTRKANSLFAAKETTRSEVLNRLCMATDYIYEYYASNIALDDLAVIACLSKFHFLRLFKEVHKQTPYQYITRIRLSKAVQLLKASTLSINEIAWAVGYEDSSTFCRSFKRRHNYWPQSYRNLVQK